VRLVILRPKISWTLLAVLDQEGNQVTGKLEYGDIGIEVQTVDTFTLENNMLVEYSIDVRHWYLLER
jgi:hypothetical protein